MTDSAGWLLVTLGLLLLVVGLLAVSGALNWFGSLPGDLRFGESTRVYIPITSMLLVSLVVSVVISIVRRF